MHDFLEAIEKSRRRGTVASMHVSDYMKLREDGERNTVILKDED